MGMANWENYPTVLGSFVEKLVGKDHEYSANTDLESGWSATWDQFAKEFPHKLWTLDGFRYARILKTVAYIVVDEDEYGNPVVQKWNIKRHKVFGESS
tara:strand:- start:606 stop:899 length:294 start_codon:yes stop_codon:yes gene_type:complete